MFTAFQNYKNELEGIDDVVEDNNVNIVADDIQDVVEKEDTELSSDVIFRVQIETSESRISKSSTKFKGMEVYEYVQNNLFKYTAGNYINDYESASSFKNKLREEGFSSAFVVAFLNGERIDLEKAIKLVKK
jgi:N-acetylmuramoyl-L-alanine amidase